MADASGLRKAYQARADRVAAAAKDDWVTSLKVAAPRGETGQTWAQIRGQVTPTGANGYRILVQSPTPQSGWTDKGTRPHVIRPRSGRALSFNWPAGGGRVAFAKVNHPGNRGSHWFRNATTATTVRQLVRQSLARVRL